MTPENWILLGFCLLPALLLLGFVRVTRWRARRGGTALLLLGNLLLLSFLVSLLLAPGELYYRFFYDEPDGFGLGLASKRWMARHYSFNNLGMRDDVDYALAIAPGRTRVTFLGDSFTNGHGVSQVEARFVNRLRDAHPEWEVHMLASDGRNTGPLLADLRQRLSAGYEIDRVVYVYCLNDLTDVMPGWRAIGRRTYSERPGLLLANSWLLNTWYYRLRAMLDPDLRSYFPRIARAYGKRPWQVQSQRLEELARLVAEHGGRLQVVTIPFLELMDDPEFRAIHAQLDRFWKERGVPHLDLLEAFESIPLEELRASRFDTHLNPEGHRLAAERIEGFLLADSP